MEIFVYRHTHTTYTTETFRFIGVSDVVKGSRHSIRWNVQNQWCIHNQLNLVEAYGMYSFYHTHCPLNVKRGNWGGNSFPTYKMNYKVGSLASKYDYKQPMAQTLFISTLYRSIIHMTCILKLVRSPCIFVSLYQIKVWKEERRLCAVRRRVP